MDQKEVNELLVSSPIGKTIKPSYDVLEQRVKELESKIDVLETEKLILWAERDRLKAENQEAYELIDAVFNHCFSTDVSYRMGKWINRHRGTKAQL